MSSTTSTEGCFFSVVVKEHLVLMPCFIGNIKKGLFEKLNSKVLEYSQELRGVLVSYSNLSILHRTGEIREDSPQVHLDIKYTAYIFKPRIGTVMKGVVNKVGEDYFTCLVNGCFNVLVVLKTTDYESESINDIEEDKEVQVKITKLPDGGDSLTLRGELYVPDKPKKSIKRKQRDNENSEHAVSNHKRKKVKKDQSHIEHSTTSTSKSNYKNKKSKH